MNRISRHQMFMMMAKAAAMRSTCARLSVGTVVVSHDRRVLSIGYNGSPAGCSHCTGGATCPYMKTSGCSVVHAEENAVSRLPDTRQGPVSVYVTHSPCMACADLLTSVSDVRNVFYETAYRDTTPLAKLEGRLVNVYRVTPSGYVLDVEGNFCEP